MEPWPWDFLFYHPATTTLLSFPLIEKCIRLAGDPFPQEQDPRAILAYQERLDHLIASLLSDPLESFSFRNQQRCRMIGQEAHGRRLIRCQRCGEFISPGPAWEVEGEIRCLACTGLEPSWHNRHEETVCGK